MSYWNASTFCKAALLAGIVIAAGCTRTENATTGTADRTADQAAMQREREEYANKLEQRISQMESRLAQMKGSAGQNTRTNDRLEDIQESLKELREEVADLRRPTAGTEWWPMTERYVERDAQRVETGVRGPNTGSAARTDTTTTPATGTLTDAELATRRDQFVQRMQAQIDQLEQELNNAPANRVRGGDIEGVRSELKDLRDEINDLKNVTATNWWDATKNRLDRTMNRIERSVENMGKDAKDAAR
jgi:peptidoglycan hydrolase CwlO-like protein